MRSISHRTILFVVLTLVVAVTPGARPLVRGLDAAGRSPIVAITQQAPGLVSIDELSMRAGARATVVPAYPGESIERKSEGVAVAALRIGVDGKVEVVRVLQAPDAAIGAAVTSAVRQWVFRPVTIAGDTGSTPVRIDTKLTFYFKIGADGRGVVSAPKARDATTGTRAPRATESPEVTEVDRADMEKLSGTRGVVVVDIRSRAQFTLEHDPSALNIPVDEIATRVRELTSAKVIIVDCYSGMTTVCQMAARELLRAGITADLRVCRRQ